MCRRGLLDMRKISTLLLPFRDQHLCTHLLLVCCFSAFTFLSLVLVGEPFFLPFFFLVAFSSCSFDTIYHFLWSFFLSFELMNLVTKIHVFYIIARLWIDFYVV